MNKHYSSARGALAFVLAFCFANLTSQAQTNFGAFQDNNFLNPNNWTNGLPGPGNNANIGGGATAVIGANHTVNYVLTSFGTINVSGVVNVATGGQLNNFSGSVFNIVGTGQLANNGGIDQRGEMNLEPLAHFTQNASGSWASTVAGTVNNGGGFSVSGQFQHLGTFNNYNGLSVVGGGVFTNNGTLHNVGSVAVSTGTLVNVNGANIYNLAGSSFAQSAGTVLNNQGTLTNDGNYSLGGSLTNNGTVANNGLFENLSGGNLVNNFRVNNHGTFNNLPASNLLNEFELNNGGTFTNNTYLDNGAAINNLAGGTFINVAGAEINNQFGASINTAGIFSNQGDILSVGDVNNSGTFVNTGSIYTSTGGGINNAGNFSNENLLSNLETIHNTGIFYNNGQLQNDSGGVFTNEGDLYNYQSARISNQFDLVNNMNLYNYGTIENGVRVFNNAYFENNGYLINIGDFLNGVTGVFENTGTSTTVGSNGGVLENSQGGVFTNNGVLNNFNEIFNFACSSFVNNGIINNYYWWTNKSLFFNYGTFNALPYHQMNMEGGVEITGPTSTEICENVSINLDANGQAKITGAAISTAAYDDCTTLTLTVNGQLEIFFGCANIGPNTVTLEIRDRTGNAVKCSATVTIRDDRAPEFQNCPSDVFVTATTTTAPATWTPPTATDNCGPVNVSSTHQPGALFPTGTTVVTYSATDGAGNGAAPCDFNVIVVPPGDCADVASVRQVTSTNDNCGSWCNGPYAATFGPGNCFAAGNDLLFVEYTNGTALLTGSIYQNGQRGFVEVCFSGRTSTPPSGSPKLELCVQQGGSGWTFYPTFSGKITLENGNQVNINRYGPAFQLGMGGNLQDPNLMGASGWFTTNGSTHGGDFNFRLSAPRACQSSITLEAECASQIGSKWTIANDANASGGKALLPPNSTSFDYPPLNTADLLTFNVDVPQAGIYRIYARASTPNGSADSYWLRVNGGNWVKWNTINNDNYSPAYQWDIAGDFRGGTNDIPLTFQLNAGANSLQFSWREPNACLDKIYITAIGKEPTGMGGQAVNCGNTPPPPPATCQNVVVKIKPDKYGSDITWKLKDANGNVRASGGPYTDNNTNLQTSTVCLPDGCYTFHIYDCYGDGICCQHGSGNYSVEKVSGGVLASSTGNYGSGETKSFCLNAAPPAPPCNRKALFIVGCTTLNASDAAVKARLVGLGYEVTVKDDDGCLTSYADGKGLVLISSTVNSGAIGSKYTNLNVPVIVWEGYLFDDLKMTGTTENYHYGSASSLRKMTVPNGNHPIVQGYTGDLTVFDAGKTMTWGLPGNGATRIAHVPGNANCVTLFTYDTGAGMVGINAPARRVGFMLHNDNANCLNNTGWLLFDKTIEWATGCAQGQNLETENSEVLKLAVSPIGNRAVDLVWANNTGYKNDLFFIERSTDGRHFEAIGEMAAYDEENNSTKIFQNLDETPAFGANYYRVGALLLDGTMIFSEIKKVEISDIADFDVFPNPAMYSTNVNLDKLLGQQQVAIAVYDWTGRPMQHFQLDEVTVPDFQIELSDLKPGTYTVVVTPAGRRPSTKKLIISK